MSKFSGVAYWVVKDAPHDWMDRALSVLSPLADAQLGSVVRDSIPAGDRIRVTLDADNYELMLAAGNGRGVVRNTATSGRWVVCLVALRRKVGAMDLVTDAQEMIPATPRRDYPLYQADWDGVLQCARALGLVSDERFSARHESVLSRMF